MDIDRFELVVKKIDPRGRLLRAWELKGGVSAQATALEMAGADGQVRKLIVRRHGEIDLNRNPQIASDEFKLLRFLHSQGLAVPEPYYVDRSGEIFPSPYLVIQYIAGETQFAPTDLTGYIRQFTANLAAIHGIDHSKAGFLFLPRQEQAIAARLRHRQAVAGEQVEDRVLEALEPVWPLPRRNRPVLLHGDYWPGNLLWRDEKLVGILDWEDAALGDPLADVANSRLEILWAFGGEAMPEFTGIFQSMSHVDSTDLPYWDLAATLRPAGKFTGWAADAEAAQRMQERYVWFIDRAIQDLQI